MARLRGATLRELAERQYKFSPQEQEILDKTHINTVPQKWLQDNRHYSVAGFTPYGKKEVNVADNAVVPKLNSSDVRRFGSKVWHNPEDILLHELGHVYTDDRKGSEYVVAPPDRIDMANETGAEHFKKRIVQRSQYPEKQNLSLRNLALRYKPKSFSGAPEL